MFLIEEKNTRSNFSHCLTNPSANTRIIPAKLYSLQMPFLTKRLIFNYVYVWCVQCRYWEPNLGHLKEQYALNC